MEIDVARVAFGCFLTLLLGPALWAPSLFNWQFRAQTRRVQNLARLIGPTGARFFYVGVGGIVSLTGLWFVATAFPSAPRPPRPQATLPTQILSEPRWSNLCLAFSPDGTRLLAGGWGLQLWDPATGASQDTIGVHELKKRRFKPVQAVAASRQGEWIALGFGDGTIYEQDSAVGRLRWDNLREYEFVPVPFSVNSVAITPDGRYALAIGISSRQEGPRTARLVDFELNEVRELTELKYVAFVEMVGTTSSAVVADQQARLKIVDLPSGEIRAEISSPAPPRGKCTALAVSPDGRWAVTCHANGGDQSMRVWDLQERVLKSRFAIRESQATAAIPSEANWFATGDGMRPEVTLWDADSGNLIRVLSAPQDVRLGIQSLTFSPDGRRIAATSGKMCYIWDLAPR